MDSEAVVPGSEFDSGSRLGEAGKPGSGGVVAAVIEQEPGAEPAGVGEVGMEGSLSAPEMAAEE